MTYKAAYLQLVKEIRATGWSVRHVKLSDAYGQIYVPKRLIEIEVKQSWERKLTTICHEWSHAAQSEEPRWKRFFTDGPLPDTPANRRYVVAAEVDASRRAKKLCKKLGFPNVYLGELDREELKRLKPMWFESYLIKPKKTRV